VVPQSWVALAVLVWFREVDVYPLDRLPISFLSLLTLRYRKIRSDEVINIPYARTLVTRRLRESLVIPVH